ncbi:hypothetical protein HPB47_023097 [Ixodes persulcatus]|uniref:Uncharacterized protein n=1 Tax=Ixodes persulcatus TaxID=34615 RepID=A0AC60Q8S9_IXOPE|nr:hypothetical protein HPB47_023097 [Ixodes persulcatus]
MSKAEKSTGVRERSTLKIVQETSSWMPNGLVGAKKTTRPLTDLEARIASLLGLNAIRGSAAHALPLPDEELKLTATFWLSRTSKMFLVADLMDLPPRWHTDTARHRSFPPRIVLTDQLSGDAAVAAVVASQQLLGDLEEGSDVND